MKYTCVTSMHKPYYDHIGSVMIESWLRYWKPEDELIVYAEGFTASYDDSRVKFLDWDQYCGENYKKFIDKIKGGPSAIFGKKGMAFVDAMKKPSCDRLVWVDADLLFYKSIPEVQLNNLLPQNKLIALFDQYFTINPKYTEEEYTNPDRSAFGAESGFVILNPSHKHYNQYVSNYINLYHSDITNPLIKSWFDSEIVLVAARNFLKDVVDLSGLRLTDKTQTPINRCTLSEYMSHQKAKSKLSYSVEQLRSFCNL